jgi:methyl-accepting chemotaxis protein PixJ
MATPESLKDFAEKSNGHQNYSEHLSDLFSEIGDLDLEGFDSDSADVSKAALLIEEFVAEKPAAKIAEEFVAELPVAKVEREPDLISFGLEADPNLLEVGQDSDLNLDAIADSFEIDSLDEVELLQAEAESIPLEAVSTETALEQVLENSDFEPEANVAEPEAIPTEAEFTQTELTHFETAAEIETEVAEIESIQAEAEPTPAESATQLEVATEPEPEVTEAATAQVSTSLEPAVAHFEVESTQAEVEPIRAEVEAESAKLEAIKELEPIEAKAAAIPVEIAPIMAGVQSAAARRAVPQAAAKLVPTANKASDAPWWQRLNLRTKATLLALTIGTLPVIATGTLAYFVTSPGVKQQAIAQQELGANRAAELASRFIFERYGDIQILSNLPILANRKGTANVTKAQKQAILDKYIKVYGVYDSIGVFDLDGNVLVQNTGDALSNHKDRAYFQAALQTQKPFISQPGYSKSTKEFVIYFAAPVFDVETGKMIAIVRSRMPVKYLSKIIEVKSNDVFLVDRDENYFVAPTQDKIGIKAVEEIPIFSRLHDAKKNDSEIFFNPKHNVEELVTYSPGVQLEGLPNLDWSVVITSKTRETFATLDNLRLALMAGTAVAAILVGAAAAFLANRATRPIIDSAEAVRKIGQGELDTRISVSGQDELAALGTNINTMASQLQSFLTQQEEEAREKQLLTEIAQAREPQALAAPLNTLLAEIRETLKLDRAVVYRFYPDWSGHIVGESVLPGWPVALADKIEDACIPKALLDAYKQGRIVPTSDVFNAGFHPDHLELMKRLQIKSNLVVPILQGEELFGILVAHHCAKNHNWQQSEINFLQEAANKLGAPLGSLCLIERQEYKAEQERNRSQAIQMELMNLLGDVQGASDGDLTVRADVGAGEIGIVADFFNSIVESLRDIVSQVKDASAQVNISVGSNEVVMGQLADEAQTQSLQVANTLKSVEQMALSIQQVAENARQAAKVAGIASTTAESGGKTMDRTVDSILMLRETVAETAKKVKRLGESSQQISKAVSLINQIALQTNLLAINASIEAARAGKEGRGFAVVAEEVGALAAQSAEATKEIEQIVENIQSETGEVVDAMERGTTQVVEGTRQVEEAKESLQQIVTVSRQINALLQSISSATVSQTEASEVVKQLMQQVTQSSERASDTSRQVSDSLQETVAIAQQLQASVGTFKVDN